MEIREVPVADVLTQGGSVAGAAGGADPVARERAMEGFRQMLAARRSALARTIARMGDPANGVELRHSADARYVLLLPDVAEPGMWRMQRFDPKGFSGHDLHPSKEALLESAAGQGFVEPDPGALDRLAQTPAFQRGNFLTDLVRQINGRTLTHDQANAQLSAYDAAAKAAEMFGGDQRLQAWFADSKAVDAGGQPRVLFHGTGADFEEFVPSARGEFGAGIYLATEARGASDYAIYRARGLPNVRPVWVSIKNPASGPEAAQVASWHGEENAQAELIRRGYDGVLDERSGQVVVFRPEQVKSSLSPHGPDAQFMATVTPAVSHGAFAGDRELSDWFGESKVVDTAGRPMVVYHGTSKSFVQFDSTLPGRAPLSKLGIYFTSDPALASKFTKAKWSGRGKAPEGANVIPVYLSIRNPKILSAYAWMSHSCGDRAIELRRRLEGQGFDGVIVTPLEDDPTGELHTEQYIAFSPSQIRFALSPHGPDPKFLARIAAAPHPLDRTLPLSEWFAGSRVCHDDGSPLMLFHGTHRPIEGPGFKDATHGPVPLTFFTNDPRAAGVYARAFGRGYGSGSNVVPVYLSMKNPKVLDFTDREDDRDLRGEAYLAAEQGFDGLIVHNAYDGRQSATQYVAFDPNQVRFALSEPQRPVSTPQPRPPAAIKRKRAHP